MLKTLSKRDLLVKKQYDDKAVGKDLLNRLKGLDNPVHHHYGLGKLDNLKSVLNGGDKLISETMYTQETNEVNYLIDKISPYINASSKVLDCGSGSGGTDFMLNQEVGCEVHGINISDKQVALTNRLSKEKGVNKKVFFQEADMKNLPFAPSAFDLVFSNETTMYVPLPTLFLEVARVLKPKGVYATIDWVSTKSGSNSLEVKSINKHYATKMHKVDSYLKVLERSGFEILLYEDLTDIVLDYWYIRQKFNLASGVEKFFISAYKNNLIKYVFHLGRKIKY